MELGWQGAASLPEIAALKTRLYNSKTEGAVGIVKMSTQRRKSRRSKWTRNGQLPVGLRQARKLLS